MRALLFAVATLIGSGAQAAVITMNFSATGFTASAPTATVTGTLTWSAASQGAPIDELLSIDMTINGHAYTLAEIGTNDISYLVIGGLVSGVGGVTAAANANDFFLGFDPLTETFISFAYSVQGVTNELWMALDGAVDVRSVTTEVPEPGSLALLALALVGMAAARRSGHHRTARG